MAYRSMTVAAPTLATMPLAITKPDQISQVLL
jgi:hypothetical protein